MKVERSVRSGQISRQRAMRSERLLLRSRPLHALEHVGRGVLERDVEIGKDFPLRHQRDDVIDMRVGIDVMQPHPDAEFAEFAREIDELGAHLALAPLACGIFEIDAVGRGVL